MAIIGNTSVSTVSTSKKNDRFINISVPAADGSSIKLGFIGLKMSDPTQAKIIEALDQDEKEENTVNLDKLLNAFTVTYNSADKKAKEIAIF